MWVGVVFVNVPLAWYALWNSCGLPVRRGESQYVRRWLNGELQTEQPSHVSGNEVWITSRGAELAYRYAPAEGDPFIVLNMDKFPGVIGNWLLTRRMRHLVDRAAHHAGITVLPLALAAWSRTEPGRLAGYRLVHRRGRECVFTRTFQGTETHFLSGFDRNESPALYFLTQLPRSATSVADAREALKPDSVRIAESEGRRVLRQGDMFAMPVQLTTEELVAEGAKVRIAKHVDGDDYRGTPLYGTAHTAERVATLPDGTMFAWGRMLHNPRVIDEFREPDHRPLKLKRDRWHLVVKNATPMVGAPTPAPTTAPSGRPNRRRRTDPLIQIETPRAIGWELVDG